MIGGGAPRVLRTAGQLADIVSFNFNNSTGTLGSASVASATVERTKEKIQWVREGAGDRFDELELEVGAYFVTVTDDPVEATAAMASRFGIAPEELASHPHALLGTVDGICETLRPGARARHQLPHDRPAQRRGVRARRRPSHRHVTAADSEHHMSGPSGRERT